MNASFRLKHGTDFPYDDGVPEVDNAHATARGVMAELLDRRGVRHELENIDHDVRAEMVQALAMIIREGMKD